MSVLLLRADAAHLPLPDASVDLVVTSPPYFGMRSYIDGGRHYAGQVGAETTPREYVNNLITCTREWMRVLKPAGSIWVNLGDKYSGAGRGNNTGDRLTNPAATRAARLAGSNRRQHLGLETAPAKSLLGVPWRYALHCIDDLGLILRAEVIWAKPNGLPESVTDRVRRSHEQWFHFVGQPRYYAAMDVIRQPHKDTPSHAQTRRTRTDARLDYAGAGRTSTVNPLGALPGSVWSIPLQPFKAPQELGVSHYAAFPMALPRRIVLGWSPSGYCTACGQPRRPIAAQLDLDMTRPQARRAAQLAAQCGLTDEHIAALVSVGISDTGRGAATQTGTGKNTAEVYALAEHARSILGGYAREFLLRRPTAFTEVCGCPDAAAPTEPATVLDPFGGTGTTALVAHVLGRIGISVDMSADYCRLATWRTTDRKQIERAARSPKDTP